MEQRTGASFSVARPNGADAAAVAAAACSLVESF
jgi:hypothetical protein